MTGNSLALFSVTTLVICGHLSRSGAGKRIGVEMRDTHVAFIVHRRFILAFFHRTGLTSIVKMLTCVSSQGERV